MCTVRPAFDPLFIAANEILTGTSLGILLIVHLVKVDGASTESDFV